MTLKELKTLARLLNIFSGEVMGNKVDGVKSVMALVSREIETLQSAISAEKSAE